MGPMRTLAVTIDWILIILLVISIAFLIYALVKKNKKLTRYALIATVIIFILLVIAMRFALTIKPGQ